MTEIIKPTSVIVARNRAVTAAYSVFGHAPDEFYNHPQPPSPLYYRIREAADASGVVWQVVGTDGYATVDRSPKHSPVAMVKIGSCLPIVVEWETVAKKQMITFFHQSGVRSVWEIERNIFESLEVFVGQTKHILQSVHRCRVLRAEDRPADGSPPTRLAEMLTSRLPVLQVETVHIPDEWTPYNFYYFQQEISVFSQLTPHSGSLR